MNNFQVDILTKKLVIGIKEKIYIFDLESQEFSKAYINMMIDDLYKLKFTEECQYVMGVNK